MALVTALDTLIHAVDKYEPFLGDLKQRAKKSGIEHLVQTHCMDMRDIPNVFQHIDMLWSEGAAYNIGFSNALTTWAPAINVDGFAVVSELSWLREQVSPAVSAFFRSGYPDMQSVHRKVAAAKNAGYNVLSTYTLPKEAWTEGYFEIIEPRAKSLLNHPNSSVRDFAVETVKEIEVFESPEFSYGHVFYVLQRTA